MGPGLGAAGGDGGEFGRVVGLRRRLGLGRQRFGLAEGVERRIVAGHPNGDYAITEVASVEGRAGFARLTLTPVEREAVDPRADASADTNADTSATANAGRADALNAGSLHLFIPQAALERHALASGTVVSAQPGPYGVAFARRDTHERFFLVLDDDWHRELASHPVSL